MPLSTSVIWLAPLRGLTDAVFRSTYAASFGGVEGAVAPFLTTTRGGNVNSKHLKDVLPQNNRFVNLVPQILSKSAPHFQPLATALYDLGYSTINWNLGCPYPMVAKKQRGSGLLPYPDKIAAFLDAVLPKIPNRLSIKLRLGYHAADEIFALLPLFDHYPLEELIIHPRTGKQMYTGQPDEASFGECLHRTNHQVAYNGDICTVEDLKRLQRLFPEVKKWMIGRGILRDPFLPERVAGRHQEPLEGLARLQQFHTDLVAHYSQVLHGPGHLLGRMKGFWSYYSMSFSQGKKYLKKIQRSAAIGKYQRYVDELFESEEQTLKFASGLRPDAR